jgi:multicomponent Na+:H+ antiporter subunit F
MWRMETFYITLALFLLLNVIAGLARIIRGPAAADRMMAAQLFGTTGVAILLLLAQGMAAPDLRNVALVFALLAVLATTAFVRATGTTRKGGDDAAAR